MTEIELKEKELELLKKEIALKEKELKLQIKNNRKNTESSKVIKKAFVVIFPIVVCIIYFILMAILDANHLFGEETMIISVSLLFFLISFSVYIYFKKKL